MKKLIITPLIILATFAGVYVLLQLFAYLIFTSRDCNWANIDHVELHIKADILNVGDTKCDYDPVENVRLVRFDFDVHPKAATSYAQKHDMNLLQNNADFQINSFLSINKEVVDNIEQNKVFVKSGKSKYSKWYMVYDEILSVLWVRIEYL